MGPTPNYKSSSSSSSSSTSQSNTPQQQPRVAHAGGQITTNKLTATFLFLNRKNERGVKLSDGEVSMLKELVNDVGGDDTDGWNDEDSLMMLLEGKASEEMKRENEKKAGNLTGGGANKDCRGVNNSKSEKKKKKKEKEIAKKQQMPIKSSKNKNKNKTKVDVVVMPIDPSFIKLNYGNGNGTKSKINNIGIEQRLGGALGSKR